MKVIENTDIDIEGRFKKQWSWIMEPMAIKSIDLYYKSMDLYYKSMIKSFYLSADCKQLLTTLLINNKLESISVQKLNNQVSIRYGQDPLNLKAYIFL